MESCLKTAVVTARSPRSTETSSLGNANDPVTCLQGRTDNARLMPLDAPVIGNARGREVIVPSCQVLLRPAALPRFRRQDRTD